MDPQALLDGLNDAQRHAVTSLAAPLCIVAGAGSGKTRVLTRRVAHRCAAGTADPRHVLVLTFTRKAAGELQHRLRTMGLRDHVTAGTFHAVAYAQLRQRWQERGVRPPALLDRKVRLLARLVGGGGRGTRISPADVATEIEWAKARLVSPEAYPAAAAAGGRRPPLGPDGMAALYERYEAERRKARLVDFDDLLNLCAKALDSDPEFAAAQRWRFRHLFVDEFQDVNPLQHRVLEGWRAGSTDLCVVGDPNQAIYAWNGADPELLHAFPRRHPSCEVVELAVNYRSSPQILAVANAVLERGRLRGVRLEPTRPDGPRPAISACSNERSEAAVIARAVRDRQGPGQPWRHQAVLARTNAQAVVISKAFQAGGIPYRLRGQVPFLELPEVREAMQGLRRSRVSFREALAGLEAAVPADELERRDDTNNPGEAADTDTDADVARARNLAELVRLAGEYEGTDQHPSVEGFRAWLLATVGREEADPNADAVEIGTFHAAKGLEWPIVHLAGLEEGLVPIVHARSNEALDEERRLFYVGLTRAERELRLTWAQQRTFGTKVSNRVQSPYLDELAPVFDALARGEAPADWRRALSRTRTRAGPAPRARRRDDGGDTEVVDPALFEALRRWRAERARAANVPAFVIFHDRTLRAIVEARPTTLRELLAVPGIGTTKAARFCDDVLAIVDSHEQVT